METVSIIIPIFNMEEYLRTCLDSVLAQTYSTLQIILIDDGSTDSSGIICDEYVAKDERITVIHKENGGVSSARNIGIEQATGKYLMFIDADDRVTEDYVANYVDVAEKENAALIIGSITIIEENIEKQNHVQCGILSQKELLLKLCREGTETVGFVSAKMYDKSFIDCYDLRFDEEMTLQEDLDFFLSFVQFISTAIYIEDDGYIYEKKPNKRILPLEYLIRNFCKLYRIADTVGVSADDMDNLVYRLQQQLYSALHHADSKREIAEIYNTIEDKRLLLDLKRQQLKVRCIIRLLWAQKFGIILYYFCAWKRVKVLIKAASFMKKSMNEEH